MKNTYIFDEYPVTLQVLFSIEKENLKNLFIKKHPDIEDRFSIRKEEVWNEDLKSLEKVDHIFFTITEEYEIENHCWEVDFLESNENNGRPFNGQGIALDESFYSDLYEIFKDKNGKTCIFGNRLETVGIFDCSAKFDLKNDGLHWEEDEY
jgi:hypothetical protein